MYKLIVFCLFLGGVIFGWSVDIQLSSPEKISKAFPPNAEVKIALEDVESLAQSSGISPKLFRAKYAELLMYRSYACTKNFTISRFDSITKVKKLPLEASCLELENNKLLQYLEMQQVAIRLSQPPLRPQFQIDEDIAIKPSGWRVATAVFSANSGVALLISEGGITDGTSTYISYDIAAGKQIAKLESIRTADINQISLSPNGRVVAIPVYKGHGGKEIVFVDTETGKILSRSEQAVGIQAWLPEVSAALLTRNGNGVLLLADFHAGKFSSYKIDSKTQSWAVRAVNSPSQVLVGTSKAFYLVQNERTAYGINSSVVKTFYPKFYGYNAYNRPLLMLGGKTAIFVLDDYLVRYDLDSRKETTIQTYAFLDRKFKKLDEETLLVKARETDEPKIFNIKDASIAGIIDGSGPYGSISPLNGRNGFMRRGPTNFLIGGMLDVGESKTLETLIAEKKLEDQLKAIEEKARNQREIDLFGIPIVDSSPEGDISLIRLDAITGEMVQDAFGNPVQKNRQVKEQTIKSKFLLSKMPANTKIEFIGVKESANTTSNEIQVVIHRSSRPILLILSSCKTVNWKIIKQPGSRLLGVFQQIKFVGERYSSVSLDNTEYATQLMTRFNYCAFEKNSPEYKELEREVFADSGKTIEKFQSAPSGVSFSVGD